MEPQSMIDWNLAGPIGALIVITTVCVIAVVKHAVLPVLDKWGEALGKMADSALASASSASESRGAAAESHGAAAKSREGAEDNAVTAERLLAGIKSVEAMATSIVGDARPVVQSLHEAAKRFEVVATRLENRNGNGRA